MPDIEEEAQLQEHIDAEVWERALQHMPKKRKEECRGQCRQAGNIWQEPNRSDHRSAQAADLIRAIRALTDRNDRVVRFQDHLQRVIVIDGYVVVCCRRLARLLSKKRASS